MNEDNNLTSTENSIENKFKEIYEEFIENFLKILLKNNSSLENFSKKSIRQYLEKERDIDEEIQEQLEFIFTNEIIIFYRLNFYDFTNSFENNNIEEGKFWKFKLNYSPKKIFSEIKKIKFIYCKFVSLELENKEIFFEYSSFTKDFLYKYYNGNIEIKFDKCIISGNLEINSQDIQNINLKSSIFYDEFKIINSTVFKKFILDKTIFEKKVIFSQIVFEDNVYINKSIFKNDLQFLNIKFLNLLRFYEIECEGITNFIGTLFKQEKEYLESDFKEKIEWIKNSNTKNSLRKDEISEDIFLKLDNFNRNSFVSNIFKNEVSFTHCDFYDRITFFNTTFEKDVTFNLSNFKNNGESFKNLEIKKILAILKSYSIEENISNIILKTIKNNFLPTSFSSTLFKDTSYFFNVNFYGNIDFIYTRFFRRIGFKDVYFKEKLNLSETIFVNEVNFLNTTSEKNNNKPIKVANRETARIIKDSFEKANNIIEANRYYALEMSEREKELSIKLGNFICKPSKILLARFKKQNKEKKEKLLNKITKFIKNDFLDYLVFKVHKISSNHSQNWILPIYWIVTITLFYSTYKNLLLNNTKTKILDISNENFILQLYQTQDSSTYYKYFVLGTSFIIVLSLIVNFYYKNREKEKSKNEILNNFSHIWTFLGVAYLTMFYSISSNNPLEDFSTNLNPFSIMNDNDKIDIWTLIYKIVIAYLIYQFVISIRQNTRRK